MGMGFISGLMEGDMKDFGRMESNMGKGSTFCPITL